MIPLWEGFNPLAPIWVQPVAVCTSMASAAAVDKFYRPGGLIWLYAGVYYGRLSPFSLLYSCIDSA